MSRRALSGRSVGRSLQRAAEQIRSQQDQCQASLRRLDESMQELIDRRGLTLLELARHYLPKITSESVLSSFEEIRSELLSVLVRKQRRQRQLAEQLEQLEDALAKQQSELERTTDELNECVARRTQLEEDVVQRLRGHEKFCQLSEEALSAEQQLERDEQRVADIRSEAAEKLPSYQKSRLFRYLVDRDFGTADYQKKGLTKTLDRWVAKLIDYPSARRSYDFLRVTPELMAAEVTRRREQFNVLMEQVEAIEDEIAEQLGLTEVMRQGQELGARRDRLVADIAGSDQQSASSHQELRELDGTKNEFYEQGVNQMKAFLAEVEHSWLEYQSSGTPERQDDELVAEIGWHNEQLSRAQRDAGSLAGEQRQWDDRSAGLQDVLQRFRQADFDSQRSQFSGALDIERHVHEFAQGTIGREELWSAIRQYQQFAPAWHQQRGWHVDGSWDTGDMSSVLGRVLVEVAGEALRHAVRRGMQRRGPLRRTYRQNSGLPRF